MNSASVPFKTLRNGHKIPVLGMGTFGSDTVSGDQVAAAVIEAARLGYRHFDCAAVYGNENLIGDSLKQVIASGVKREDLFITSKLWNNKHVEADVVPAFKKTLDDLGLQYLDLYLIHWPFPNHHAPGVDVHSRAHDAKPYIHSDYMKIWHKLETLVDLGLVRSIGTSNMTIPKLELVLRDARIQPAVNEMELHPHFQQEKLFQYVVSQDMVPIGFSPIGSPGRPQRDRTAEDTVDTEDPVILEIARKRGVSPATICLQWGLQRGHVVIPFSVNPKNLQTNLEATVAKPLSNQEMAALSRIDRNCRLVKGQVFLWKEGQTWEDLWDPEGTIVT
jgi:diketogulonate reductase-like aldo/keto reductase